MVGGGKLTSGQCNFIHQDQIWKDYVHKEVVTTKKWEGTWGFLTDEYHTLNRDLTQVRRKTSSQSTPLKLPPLQAPKQDTSNPFPLVTSREIGWRYKRNLEFFGRWGRPKYSIQKQLGWPNDAVP